MFAMHQRQNLTLFEFLIFSNAAGRRRNKFFQKMLILVFATTKTHYYFAALIGEKIKFYTIGFHFL